VWNDVIVAIRGLVMLLYGVTEQTTGNVGVTVVLAKIRTEHLLDKSHGTYTVSRLG
jgi:hypothetical protein